MEKLWLKIDKNIRMGPWKDKAFDKRNLEQAEKSKNGTLRCPTPGVAILQKLSN